MVLLSYRPERTDYLDMPDDLHSLPGAACNGCAVKRAENWLSAAVPTRVVALIRCFPGSIRPSRMPMLPTSKLVARKRIELFLPGCRPDAYDQFANRLQKIWEPTGHSPMPFHVGACPCVNIQSTSNCVPTENWWTARDLNPEHVP